MRKNIRQIKRELRNFSKSIQKPTRARHFARSDDESEGVTLEDKCEIINRILLGDHEEYYLNPEKLMEFLEECSETWTCSGEKCKAAIKQLGRVIAYLMGKTDEKPTSMAVSDPAEVLDEYTDARIILGYKKPFDYAKDIESQCNYIAESYIEDHLKDDEDFRQEVFENGYLSSDSYDEIDEELKDFYLDNDDYNLSHLIGNDDAIESQGIASPDELNPEDDDDVNRLNAYIRIDTFQNEPGLIDYNAIIERCVKKQKQRKPNKALIKAVENNDIEATKKALNAGADPNVECGGVGAGSILLESPIIWNKNLKLAKVLLDAGADINAKFQAGAFHGEDDTLLDYVVREKPDIETIKFLIKNGADVNIGYGSHSVPVCYAAASEDKFDILKLLVDAGAKDIDKALHTALYNENIKALKYLADKVDDINGETFGEFDDPILLAALRNIENKPEEFIKVLLAAGADIDAENNYGTTALTGATFVRESDEESADLVQLLIDAGADVNHKRVNDDERMNETPLMAVAKNEDGDKVKTAELLLKAGADPSIKDHYGKTALDYARKHNHIKVAKLLEEVTK